MDSTSGLLLYFGVFGLIIYFLMIRPQKKQQKERNNMLESLKVKDKVVTIGGIHGRIVKVKEDTIIVQVADKVELEMEKGAVNRVTNREITVDKNKKADKDAQDKKQAKTEELAKAEEQAKIEEPGIKEEKTENVQ